MILEFFPLYFWDLGSSLLSLLCIIFQVVYLFSLHLFGLVGFYLVPSFARYFSVFSFYLTYCVWVLPSPGYRVIVPLIFGLCPWWVRLILWFVQASHWERLVPAFWREEVFFSPLMGCVRWCFGISLGRLLIIGFMSLSCMLFRWRISASSWIVLGLGYR